MCQWFRVCFTGGGLGLAGVVLLSLVADVALTFLTNCLVILVGIGITVCCLCWSVGEVEV